MNPVPNLDAKLIPGVSAAGFKLGMSMDELRAMIGPTRTGDWRDLEGNQGWLETRYDRGYAVFINLTYGNCVVQLILEEGGTLHEIVVEAGYRGRYRGVGIGDALSALERFAPLNFDDADEVFYLGDDDAGVPGVHFQADAPNQPIRGISIHDWALGPQPDDIELI